MLRNLSKKNVTPIMVVVFLLILVVVFSFIFLKKNKDREKNLKIKEEAQEKEMLVVQKLNIVGEIQKNTKKEEEAALKKLKEEAVKTKTITIEQKENIIKMLEN